ncbi:MAG: STAS domain-containing protein [Myxococcales bacterium FL481]|nr:MAG: STAS domain-containing protein [Myxococcales bacterium FL481]
MLLALRRPGPDSGALRLPTGLDAAQPLFEFTAEIDEQLATTTVDLVLDCSDITRVAPPVLGWLVSTATRLAGAGRRVVLSEAGPQFRLQLRSLGAASDQLVVSPTARRTGPTSAVESS